MTDNVHVQSTRTRGGDLYKGDDIEIWFDTDLAGDFASREGNADDFQLGLSPGDFEGLAPEAYFWNPDRKPERIRLVTVAARPREGGEERQWHEINAEYRALIEGYFGPHLKSGALRRLPADAYASLVLGPAHDYARRVLSGQIQGRLSSRISA